MSNSLAVNSVVTNSAEVTDALSRDPDSTPANGSTNEDDDASAAFTVIAPPTADVAVTKTVDRANAGVGDVVAYTITVTNNGPDAISGGVLNDVLPASLGFQTYSTTPLNSGVYNPATGNVELRRPRRTANTHVAHQRQGARRHLAVWSTQRDQHCVGQRRAGGRPDAGQQQRQCLVRPPAPPTCRSSRRSTALIRSLRR